MKPITIFQIILNIVIIPLFLTSGITVLLLRQLADSYNRILLGTTLLVAGIVKFIIYFLNKGYKNPRNITIITSIIMIALGIIFFVSDKEVEMLCFGWGVVEIVLGLIEVYIDIIEIREDKIAVLEMVINTATIVFGVLLCIKLSAGLSVHLVFLGISLILLAVIALLKLIRRLKAPQVQKDEEEKHRS